MTLIERLNQIRGHLANNEDILFTDDLALLLRIVEIYQTVISAYANPEGSGKKTHFYAEQVQADVEKLVSEEEK